MIRGHLKHLALAALKEKPLTGYDLMAQLGACLCSKPSPGSVYPLLSELERAGLIIVKDEGRRRVYSITSQGRSELKTLSSLKEDIFSQMGESARIAGMLTGDDMRFFEHIAGSLQKGEVPFREVAPEMARFRRLMGMMASDGVLSRRCGRVRTALARLNSELEMIIGDYKGRSDPTDCGCEPGGKAKPARKRRPSR